MIEIKDQIGSVINLEKKPVKIISLVPSQTELLHDLGLDKEVIGITKFCVHPKKWKASKEKVGGTKNLNFSAIRRLKPDIILANKEENDESQVKILMNEYPVWVSDVKNLKQALEMINMISRLTQKQKKGQDIIRLIKTNFKSLTQPFKKRRCVYLIWNKPLMAVGGDTFISNMLGYTGFVNVFEKLFRYPVVSDQNIIEADPEVIFLSSEPFPYFEKYYRDFKLRFPNSIIQLVDGEMYSWYGSRMIKSPHYFMKLRKRIINSFQR